MPATRSVREILLTAAPLGLAVFVFGVSFGVLAIAARFPGWAAVLMSALVFAVSAQFSALGVITAGGSSVTARLAGAVYGPALADAFGQARGAVRDWRSPGRSGAGPIHTARGSTRRRRVAWVMAGSLALALVLGLAGISFVMRAIGPFLPNIPAAITQRTTGLAPALLAALVSIQLTGPNGLLHLDVKVPAVILAALLSALRLALIVCVVAGAFLAVLLPAVFHL